MLSKKTEKGNLENRKITFALIGLVLVLGLVYAGFELFAPQKSHSKLTSTEVEFVEFDQTETPIVDLTPIREQIPQEVLKDWIIRTTEGPESMDWEAFIKSLGIGYNDPIPEPFGGEIEPLIEPPHDDPPPLPYSEVMPEYPGGKAAMYEFLRKQIVYPERARTAGIQGISLIEFVVEKNGSVSNATVLSPLHPDCDNEAIRVIKMLKFSPGLVNKQPVRVYYMIPVQFLLQN